MSHSFIDGWKKDLSNNSYENAHEYTVCSDKVLVKIAVTYNHKSYTFYEYKSGEHSVEQRLESHLKVEIYHPSDLIKTWNRFYLNRVWPLVILLALHYTQKVNNIWSFTGILTIIIMVQYFFVLQPYLDASKFNEEDDVSKV